MKNINLLIGASTTRKIIGDIILDVPIAESGRVCQHNHMM